jgi:hypothetical protein
MNMDEIRKQKHIELQAAIEERKQLSLKIGRLRAELNAGVLQDSERIDYDSLEYLLQRDMGYYGHAIYSIPSVRSSTPGGLWFYAPIVRRYEDKFAISHRTLPELLNGEKIENADPNEHSLVRLKANMSAWIEIWNS